MAQYFEQRFTVIPEFANIVIALEDHYESQCKYFRPLLDKTKCDKLITGVKTNVDKNVEKGVEIITLIKECEVLKFELEDLATRVLQLHNLDNLTNNFIPKIMLQ